MNKAAKTYLKISTDSTGIRKLMLNSKPVNALVPQLLLELRTELSEINRAKDIRGLIFGSEFPRVLSAGLDLKTLVDHPEYFIPDSKRPAKFTNYRELYKKHVKDYLELFQDCVRLLITLQAPTVAIVSGQAPAGGTVLSLCCDHRLGSKLGFAMGLSEVAVGMAPPLWVHRMAQNALGNRRAAIALQSGSIYGEDDCLKFGFVDKIVDEKELMNEATKYIHAMSSLPWQARVDAKMKSISNVVSEFNEANLNGIVDSISGNEFQETCKGILETLKKSKSK